MTTSLAELQKKLNYDYTFSCVQCGYCLPACPTYETMGKETHSPRGRINLVKLAAEGKLDLEDLREPIDKCLGCRACQSVCPTGVQYGKILEGAKTVLAERKELSTLEKLVKKLVFEELFPKRSRMNMLGHLTWFYQQTGLQSLARKLRLTSLAPANLDKFEAVLEPVVSPRERKQRREYYAPLGEKKVRVGFFTGCVMDTIFFETNQNTIELLRRAGAEVIIPQGQTCCGALHAHAGDVEQAKILAKRNIEAFENEQVDYVINNAGGCGAMLVEYDQLFDDEPEWKERAERFSRRTKDISTLLHQLDSLTFTRPIEGAITYQASCHLTHVQKENEAPLAMIKKLPEIVFRPMKDYDRCCGSAGIYNIVNYEDSMEILDGKMEKVKATEATTIVTTNPGCLLQMKLGIHRENLQEHVRAVHLVDLLMEAEPRPKEMN